MLLLLLAVEENNLVEGADAGIGAEQQDQAAPAQDNGLDEDDLTAEALARAATDEAVQTARGLWIGFVRNLPRLVVAALAFLLAWLFLRVTRPVLRRTLRSWERSNATLAVFGIVVWLFAIGVALSVLAGDIRALVGSVGLIGLALSWALQTPIESFTGWLMNSFQGYYKVGDRVAVGEVFGDVYRIDFLTTTVWEIGSPGRVGFVQAEQPTGRLITFPNNEVLAGTVVNLTRDFPFVWDELSVQVANESDLRYAQRVLLEIATDLLGDYMKAPSKSYEAILSRARLETSVPPHPQVFVSMNESWTDITIRYLVGARERRKWKSELVTRVTEALNKREHAEKIIAVYPRHQLQFIRPDGKAVSPPMDGEGRAYPHVG